MDPNGHEIIDVYSNRMLTDYQVGDPRRDCVVIAVARIVDRIKPGQDFDVLADKIARNYYNEKGQLEVARALRETTGMPNLKVVRSANTEANPSAVSNALAQAEISKEGYLVLASSNAVRVLQSDGTTTDYTHSVTGTGFDPKTGGVSYRGTSSNDFDQNRSYSTTKEDLKAPGGTFMINSVYTVELPRSTSDNENPYQHYETDEVRYLRQ